MAVTVQDGDAAYFNPRSPCGERPSEGVALYLIITISIHAPRVGSDACAGALRRLKMISIHAPRVGSDCQIGRSTQPADISIHAPRVGSDGAVTDAPTTPIISIHAPRVGSDHLSQQPRTGRSNFNPRSPCGERQQRCTNTASVCCAIRHILQKICSSLIILLHLQ